MSTKDDPRFITSLWRNLKRALTSTPDIQNDSTMCQECSIVPATMNTSNYSSPNGVEQVLISDIQVEKSIKRQRLNLAIDQVGLSEENSFMEIMKNLLSCSICLEVNNYSNQCPNGHLICITCSGRLQQSPGDLSCPVCRVSLKQGLHRSLLAEQLTSELPAACRHCKIVMPVKLVKKHESHECPKRMVQCKYKLFGCSWIGIEEGRDEHVDKCSIATEKVGDLHSTVSENMSKDFNLLQLPLQLWRSIVSKIRVQSVGSRMLIRQTALNKSVGEDACQSVFKSPMIRAPFSCCSLHGFYIDIMASKKNDADTEKIQYTLRSENRTKVLLNYFIATVKVDESVNLDVQDSLHSHQFESNHKESQVHEIKLVSLDCDKDPPRLSSFDSIVVEICFISERERSERGHGILNSNEEDETNGFMSTSGSDSNVVFTLFSPTTSSSRSMNTSNTMVPNNEDPNGMNEVEPSHEEDIVITVTENIDNGDDIAVDTREHYASRNNHSYVAVPSVFLNPTTSVFTYSPFQLENTFINGSFQQPARIAREAQFYEPDNQPVISEQEVVRLQTGNLNRTARPGEVVATQDDYGAREPIHMSLFYPPQTIVSPYITNSVSPIAVRPSVAPRNIIVRPRHNPNQVLTRQPRLIGNINEDNRTLHNPGDNDSQTFQNYITLPLTESDNGVHTFQNLITLPASESDQNNELSQSSPLNEPITLEDSSAQGGLDAEV